MLCCHGDVRNFKTKMAISSNYTSLFTALHGMQTQSRDESCQSVCLSVCLFVKGVHCDKTEEISVQIFIPHER